jgi:hypothetical protein
MVTFRQYQLKLAVVIGVTFVLFVVTATRLRYRCSTRFLPTGAGPEANGADGVPMYHRLLLI